MRSLVVSDLHLGARSDADVLRSAAARARLLEQVRGCKRLVVLGDVLELRHDPLRQVLDAAGPVLRALGEAVGPGGEVLVVPGNHDHRLLGPWLERRALHPETPPLGLQSPVEWRVEEPLAEIAALLSPATLKVHYPGIWLRPDVYATHGHYSDRHITVPIMERVAAGVMTRLVSEPPGGPRRAEDYEATLTPIYAWIDAVAQGGIRGRGGGKLQVRAWHALQRPRRPRGLRGASLAASIRGTVLAAAFPLTIAALNLARIGPLDSDVSGEELRRAGLRAMAEVLERLSIRAAYVIFGHTHRAGPLPGEDPLEWRVAGSELLNTGCWVSGDGFLGAAPGSPYRPGFCAVLEDEGPPGLINALD